MTPPDRWFSPVPRFPAQLVPRRSAKSLVDDDRDRGGVGRCLAITSVAHAGLELERALLGRLPGLSHAARRLPRRERSAGLLLLNVVHKTGGQRLIPERQRERGPERRESCARAQPNVDRAAHRAVDRTMKLPAARLVERLRL